MSRNLQYNAIIENIKRIIAEKGMKQSVVAKRAGFSPQEFSNILNERRKLLRVEHVLPISKALNVDANDILGVDKKEVE